jgi:hypothetical protein
MRSPFLAVAILEQRARDRDAGFAGDAASGSTPKGQQPGPPEEAASPNPEQNL